MLHLILLILLTIFLYSRLKKILHKGLMEKKNSYERLNHEYENLVQQNSKLKSGNAGLERFAEEIIALYDITKDICNTLDVDKIFNIFHERIDKEIGIGDCRFLKEAADLSPYKDYTVLPLMIDKNPIGYLVASNIQKKDEDKFHILAQQFLMGIKRAILYQKVLELAITDSLTQVFSRRYFFERLNEEFERSRKFKLKFSFLMVDIDHFKYFNDHYGHLVGDTILREISKTIKENVRQIDFIGRYGGEELSIILTETGKDNAHFAAERIRQAIESKYIRVYDEDLRVTISIGIATFADDARDIRVLIDRADEALYLAKQTGRNRVCFYEAHK